MEYMTNDDTVKGMEKDRHFVIKARQYLGEQGVRNLFEDGMLKVLRGVTGVEEVLRVTG
jgi:type II secretory ATPase GspE/PulE/Tfp pilus assembly ATPase PilB-like protein